MVVEGLYSGRLLMSQQDQSQHHRLAVMKAHAGQPEQGGKQDADEKVQAVRLGHGSVHTLGQTQDLAAEQQ